MYVINMYVYTLVECMHVNVCIQQLRKLVFTMRECYHCISDHGKIMLQLVMLSRSLPICRRRSGEDKTVYTTSKWP